ncbi:MAG: metal-dependent hydrolase [Thermoplasmata archaeon]
MRKNVHIIGALCFGIMGLVLLGSVKRGALPYVGWPLIALLHKPFITIVIMLVMSFFGGIVPDILDPPYSPKHRRFAHSKALLAILLVLWGITLIALLNQSSLGLCAIYYMLLGYISHLALDSLTPSGLW